MTPLMSGHSIRGIGRYVRGIVDALTTTRPAWCQEHLALLLTSSQAAPAQVRATWRTRRTPVRPQDIGWIVAGFSDRLTLRGADVDIWHETDPSNPIGQGPASQSLVTAHDLIPLLEPSVMTGIRRHRRVAYDLYVRRLVRAHRVLAVSRTTALDLEAVLGIRREQIAVVYPAVQPLVRPTRRRDAAASSFLFVGVPEPHKRAELALQAFSAYRRRGGSMSLSYVGYHPPDVRDRLQRLVDVQALGPHVVFAGLVDDLDLAALYSSGILLAISTREGFGLPAVECLLTGGRVVATPSPIYHEVLGQAAEFSASDSPEDIATSMFAAEVTAPDPGFVRDLIDRFAPSSIANQLIDVYGWALS